MAQMTKHIYFVHAVDTEGPLYESLEAKFNRIKNVYNIDIESKTEENLKRIKNREMSLGGMENEIAQMLSGHLTNYNDDWNKISEMHEILFDENLEQIMQILKAIHGFLAGTVLIMLVIQTTQEERDLGHHKIFDYYQKLLNNKKKTMVIKFIGTFTLCQCSEMLTGVQHHI